MQTTVMLQVSEVLKQLFLKRFNCPVAAGSVCVPSPTWPHRSTFDQAVTPTPRLLSQLLTCFSFTHLKVDFILGYLSNCPKLSSKISYILQ